MTRTLFAAFAALALAACGGSSSPTSPESMPAGAGPASETAAIHGTVAGGTSSALFSTASGAGAGMTISVQGTNIQATTNGLGQFTLSNVPAGTTVVLLFTGAGANANLPLGALGAGETVTITVAVSGDQVEVQEKTQGNSKEIEGRIESIEGSTLRVRARTVMVTPSTVIRRGSTAMTIDQLEVGQRVHVKGTVAGDGDTAVTTATEIKVQNTNTTLPVNLEGTVSGLTGTASAFEFVVRGRTVKGGAATEFKGGRSPSFDKLADGDEVHVKGTQENGFVQATRINLQGNDDDDDDDGDDDSEDDDSDDDDGEDDDGDEFEARGAVAGLSGACPAIAFTLNGTSIRATSSTEFKQIGCAAIANGTQVKVEGERQTDGSVIARQIKRD